MKAIDVLRDYIRKNAVRSQSSKDCIELTLPDHGKINGFDIYLLLNRFFQMSRKGNSRLAKFECLPIEGVLILEKTVNPKTHNATFVMTFDNIKESSVAFSHIDFNRSTYNGHEKA